MNKHGSFLQTNSPFKPRLQTLKLKFETAASVSVEQSGILRLVADKSFNY